MVFAAGSRAGQRFYGSQIVCFGGFVRVSPVFRPHNRNFHGSLASEKLRFVDTLPGATRIALATCSFVADYPNISLVLNGPGVRPKFN